MSERKMEQGANCRWELRQERSLHILRDLAESLEIPKGLIKSMLEPRQNPSCGILDKQEWALGQSGSQDLLWILRIPL